MSDISETMEKEKLKNDKFIEKVYVTKYALTKGILVFKKVKHCLNISIDMISITDRYNQCFHKGEWYIDLDKAITMAENMRFKKIESMKKKITKLEKMEFKLKDD